LGSDAQSFFENLIWSKNSFWFKRYTGEDGWQFAASSINKAVPSARKRLRKCVKAGGDILSFYCAKKYSQPEAREDCKPPQGNWSSKIGCILQR